MNPDNSNHANRPGYGLPPVAECLQRSRALAMLDAILCPEWSYRYFSFNCRWAPGEQMASMRDGSGSHSFLWFGNGGAILKTYDRDVADQESVEAFLADLPAVVPTPYQGFLTEPAFILDEVTSVAWSDPVSGRWQRALPDHWQGEQRDHSLLSLLASGDPAAYVAWASDYFEREVPLDAVRAVFRMEPLTGELLASLNPDVTWEKLSEDLEEIGFPVAPS